MAIIDSQVHAYEANTPKRPWHTVPTRPWHTVPNWPEHVTGDEMVAAMDSVGVDGAIFISASSVYRFDASYAVEMQRAHPGRLAIVKPIDPDDPAVADVIADWKRTPGAIGIRIMMTKEAGRQPDDPGLDRILCAAVRHDFPVNMLCWGNVDPGASLIDRHPDARRVVDINALSALAPLPRAAVPQDITPPAPHAAPRWSRRHSSRAASRVGPPRCRSRDPPRLDRPGRWRRTGPAPPCSRSPRPHRARPRRRRTSPGPPAMPTTRQPSMRAIYIAICPTPPAAVETRTRSFGRHPPMSRRPK
jgi:hypothetical protein